MHEAKLTGQERQHEGSLAHLPFSPAHLLAHADAILQPSTHFHGRKWRATTAKGTKGGKEQGPNETGTAT